MVSVGFSSTYRRTLEQCQKSWYMLLIQHEGIGERWITRDNWYDLRSPDWTGHPDADGVIADLEATGSLTPALNWYRANFPPESWVGQPAKLSPVQAPTMGIWSTGDRFCTEVE